MISSIVKRFKTCQSPSTTSSRIMKGIIWNFFGLIFNKGFAMLASIIVARYLGSNLFGQYGMINSTISTFATFAGLGLGVTATKFIAEYKITNKEKVGRILGLTNIFGFVSGILMTLIVYFGSDWLAVNQLNTIEMAPFLRISAITLLINTYNGIQRSSLSGFEKFSKLAKIDAIVGCISFVLTVVGTVLYGLTGILIVNIITGALSLALCSYTLFYSLKEFNIKIDYLRFYYEIRAFMQISLPSLVSNIMIGPVQWFANVLFIVIPNGYSALGIFNAAFQWKNLLQMIPSIFNLALVPVLLSSKEEKSERLDKVNMLLSWGAVVLISLPIINLPDVISFFYGKQYISYNYHIAIVFGALTAIMLSFKEGMARAILSDNKMWRGVADNVLWAVVLISSVIKLRDLGAMGMSISYFLAYLVTAIVFIPYNIYKGTIKKSSIFSKKVVYIWLLILLETAFTIINIDVRLRLVIAIMNYSVLLFIVMKELKNKKAQMN